MSGTTDISSAGIGIGPLGLSMSREGIWVASFDVDHGPAVGTKGSSSPWVIKNLGNILDQQYLNPKQTSFDREYRKRDG